MSHTEVRFAGEGGQGLILASVILGDAAARAGLHVVQSEQYGPESRGGQTWADVIIADRDVDYPQARDLDMLVALSAKGLTTSLQLLRPQGLLLADSTRVPVDGVPERRLLLPLADLARRAAGRPVPPNLAALGALVAVTDLVSFEALVETALSRMSRANEEASRRALEAGYEAARAAAAADGRMASGTKGANGC